MKIKATRNSITDIVADAVVVNLFHGVRYPGGATGAVDSAMGNRISREIREGHLSGKFGEIFLLESPELRSSNVIIAGLGNSQRFDLNRVREISRLVAEAALRRNFFHLATIVHGGGIGGLDFRQAIDAVLFGSYDTLGSDRLLLEICEVSPNKFDILSSYFKELSGEAGTPFEYTPSL